jgi:hypothetical protein
LNQHLGCRTSFQRCLGNIRRLAMCKSCLIHKCHVYIGGKKLHGKTANYVFNILQKCSLGKANPRPQVGLQSRVSTMSIFLEVKVPF